MTVLWMDSETFSPTPIKDGGYRYSESVEVMLVPYAIDDGPVKCWDRTENIAQAELYNAVKDPSVQIVFHNCQFDRVVMAQPPLSWVLDQSRIFDTMACALSHSMPGKLETLCEILGLGADKAKLKTGRELIQFFCKPTKNGGRNTRLTHPEKWEEFKRYAMQDVEAMREIYKKLPKWNYPNRERDLFDLDQLVNGRGFAVDVELATAAVQAVDDAQRRLAAETQEITGGLVMSTTQRNALLAYLRDAYDIELPDLRAATVEAALKDAELPNSLVALLLNRLQATTSSTAKYRTLLKSVSSDGRLRGALQYCGANRTGRWSGRLFQPQNLPRPTLKQRDIDMGIDALKAECADLMFPNVMELTSSSIRGCIVAPLGKKLVVADLSNIEGRVLAWLAGETWKLNAFSAYDTVTGYDYKGKAIRAGHDLYALAYAKSFAVTPESVMADKDAGGDQRQVGKVQELALGYEGGVGAFLTFAAAYGLDLDELPGKMGDTVPDDVREECDKFWEWCGKSGNTFGLKEETFKACDALKRLWRRAHPNVVALWSNLKEAVRQAAQHPGTAYTVYAGNGEERLKVIRVGAWLRIRLPSGRYLCYPHPEVGPLKCEDCDGVGKFWCDLGDLAEEDEEPHWEVCPHCAGKGRIPNDKITYKGINQYNRKWGRIATYGGKLVENVTQAVARDVLAEGMKLAEARGYQVVLSVHDELLTETPDRADYSHDDLAEIMSTNPVWAGGLPLAAAGFEAHRYKKD